MKNIVLPSEKEIDKQIASIEEKLLYIPKGEFYVARNGKYVRWRTGGGRGVSKKKRTYACKLCARKYYEALVGYLKKLKRASKAYEFAEKSQANLILNEMHADIEYASLLKEYFQDSFDSACLNWDKRKYDSNLLFIEDKKVHTLSGVMVRSKSEMIIADALTRHNIPFRYECPLELNGFKFYPDFTILVPKNHKEIIWEHFGLMDDKKYRAGVWHKLDELAECGYIMGYDFIYTMESGNHPLDTFAVEDMIQRYLL